MGNLSKFKKIIALFVGLVVVLGCAFLLMDHFADDAQDESDVRELVESFGKSLHKVSLLAPEDIVNASIEENYSEYVTPELLQKWQDEPQSAPGRLVSSPWPDRIDIISMEMTDKDRYIVNGEIIEITSAEVSENEAAAKRQVTIEVFKSNDRWLIADVMLGEYAVTGSHVYENTKYGLRFNLPKTWAGYSIVEEQWEGTRDGELDATGPQLLIRHPDWTAEEVRQDIPIMIFTPAQWEAIQNEELAVSAAPIGPSILGSNSSYVFALPARYNYAFPTGYEEVEEILQGKPLMPLEDINVNQ